MKNRSKKVFMHKVDKLHTESIKALKGGLYVICRL